jgi:hypothetical protein
MAEEFSTSCAVACTVRNQRSRGIFGWRWSRILALFCQLAANHLGLWGERRVGGTGANCMKPQPAEIGSALRFDRDGLDQALKLSPQEQVLAALGFLNLNPPSCKAST